MKSNGVLLKLDGRSDATAGLAAAGYEEEHLFTVPAMSSGPTPAKDCKPPPQSTVGSGSVRRRTAWRHRPRRSTRGTRFTPSAGIICLPAPGS